MHKQDRYYDRKFPIDNRLSTTKRLFSLKWLHLQVEFRKKGGKDVHWDIVWQVLDQSVAQYESLIGILRRLPQFRRYSTKEDTEGSGPNSVSTQLTAVQVA